MNNNKISIIVPVYNGSEYILNCLNSIYQQEGNYEVLLINDGSTDNTLEIVNKNLDMYPNLRVIDTVENYGVSNARNLGLNYATGKFIMFCDADDQYSQNTISSISDILDSYNPDYIIFNRVDVLNSKIIAEYGGHHSVKIINESRYNYILNYFSKGIHTFSVCNKVFKKRIIDENSIKFDCSINLSEDTLFNLEYLLNANSYIEFFRTSYIRIYREGSAIYKPIENFYSSNIKIIDILHSKVSSSINEEKLALIENSFYYHYGKVSIFRYFDKIDGKNFFDRIRSIKNLFKDSNFRNGFNAVNRADNKRELIFQICIKYRLAILSYLLFSSAAGIKRKIKSKVKHNV